MKWGLDQTSLADESLTLSDRLFMREALRGMQDELINHGRDVTSLGSCGDSRIPSSIAPLAWFPKHRMPAQQSIDIQRLMTVLGIDVLVTTRDCVLSRCLAAIYPSGWQDLVFGLTDGRARQPWPQLAWVLANYLLVEGPSSAEALRAHLPQISGEIVPAELVWQAATGPWAGVPEKPVNRKERGLRWRPSESSRREPRHVAIVVDTVDELFRRDLDLILSHVPSSTRLTGICEGRLGSEVSAASDRMRVLNFPEEAPPQDADAIILAGGIRAPLSVMLHLLRRCPTVPIVVGSHVFRLLPEGLLDQGGDNVLRLGLAVPGFAVLGRRAAVGLQYASLRIPLSSFESMTEHEPMVDYVKQAVVSRLPAIACQEF